MLSEVLKRPLLIKKIIEIMNIYIYICVFCEIQYIICLGREIVYKFTLKGSVFKWVTKNYLFLID